MTEEYNLNSTGARTLEKAKEQLQIVKDQEIEKLKKGYKWLYLGKENILSHPKKIDQRIKEGWKFVKK